MPGIVAKPGGAAAPPSGTVPAAMTPPPDADPELVREQAHHDESRRQLARMRERTAALDAGAGADRVSREVLEGSLRVRMEQLADDPTVPLFFGRIDGDAEGALHIGRRHVSDPAGDPLVIDWRAPVSLPFYRASATEPMGVEGRRRYGFHVGRLTAYEDERLGSGEAVEHSAILESEIERPRVGPMRDIVATIQPEQDVIVRADLARTVCVQGAPGTGKTAVGLHRAAFLLYAHREQLRRQGVLVVGPNASFLRYIRDVLPALGEIEARQTTIELLVTEESTTAKPVRVRADDPTPTAVLKGDARMALVLERAVWAHVGTPAYEGLMVPWGSRRHRVLGDDVAAVLAGLRARGSATTPDGRCCRSRWPTACWSRWRAPGSRPTTGCRTRWRGAGRCATTPRRSGRPSNHDACCGRCCPTPRRWPRPRTAC
jgi:hypothetical protein